MIRKLTIRVPIAELNQATDMINTMVEKQGIKEKSIISITPCPLSDVNGPNTGFWGWAYTIFYTEKKEGYLWQKIKGLLPRRHK